MLWRLDEHPDGLVRLADQQQARTRMLGAGLDPQVSDEQLAKLEPEELARQLYLASELALEFSLAVRLQDEPPSHEQVQAAALAFEYVRRCEEAQLLALAAGPELDERTLAGLSARQLTRLHGLVEDAALRERIDAQHLLGELRSVCPPDTVAAALNERDLQRVEALRMVGGKLVAPEVLQPDPGDDESHYDWEADNQYGHAWQYADDEHIIEQQRRESQAGDERGYGDRHWRLVLRALDDRLVAQPPLGEPDEQGRYWVQLRDADSTPMVRNALADFPTPPEPAPAEQLCAQLQALQGLLRSTGYLPWNGDLGCQYLRTAQQLLRSALCQAGLVEADNPRGYLDAQQLADLDEPEFARYLQTLREMEGRVYAWAKHNELPSLDELLHGLSLMDPGPSCTQQELLVALLARQGQELSPLNVLQVRELDQQELQRQFDRLRPLSLHPTWWVARLVEVRFGAVAGELLRRQLRAQAPEGARYALFERIPHSDGELGHHRHVGYSGDDPGQEVQLREDGPYEFTWMQEEKLFDKNQLLDLQPVAAPLPEPTDQTRRALEAHGVELEPMRDQEAQTLSYQQLTEHYTALADAAQQEGPAAVALALPRLDSLMRWQLIRVLSDRDKFLEGAVWYAVSLYPALVHDRFYSGPVLGAAPGYGVVGLGYYDAQRKPLTELGRRNEEDWPTVRASPSLFDVQDNQLERTRGYDDDDHHEEIWLLKLDRREVS